MIHADSGPPNIPAIGPAISTIAITLARRASENQKVR